jgi:hypothetical protein
VSDPPRAAARLPQTIPIAAKRSAGVSGQLEMRRHTAAMARTAMATIASVHSTRLDPGPQLRAVHHPRRVNVDRRTASTALDPGGRPHGTGSRRRIVRTG